MTNRRLYISRIFDHFMVVMIFLFKDHGFYSRTLKIEKLSLENKIKANSKSSLKFE